MKQSFLTFCSVLALFMYSCTDVKLSDEYKKVVFDRDSLAESLSEREQDVLEFAKEFDLLLFADESCRYCREFAPVLKRFVDQHHFQLDVASLDSKAGSIAKSLGINSIPTLVAIKKDGSLLFEVSRGVVSTSQLEANILLASKYSKELKATSKQGKHGVKQKSRGHRG